MMAQREMIWHWSTDVLLANFVYIGSIPVAGLFDCWNSWNNNYINNYIDYCLFRFTFGLVGIVFTLTLSPRDLNISVVFSLYAVSQPMPMMENCCLALITRLKCSNIIFQINPSGLTGYMYNDCQWCSRQVVLKQKLYKVSVDRNLMEAA